MDAAASFYQQCIQPFYEEPMPEYGYAYNIGEGLGSELLRLNRLAVSLYNDSNNQPTPWECGVERVKAVFLMAISSPLTLAGAVVYAVSKLMPHRRKEVTDVIYARTDPKV